MHPTHTRARTVKTGGKEASCEEWGLPQVDCSWAPGALVYQPVLERPRWSKASQSNGVYEREREKSGLGEMF